MFFVRKIRDQTSKNLALILSMSVLFAVTVFIAYKDAKIDMLFADAISDNNLLQAPFISHDINIQAIHTHLLKWPVAIIENLVGFTVPTHFVASLFILVLMNAGLGYIFYRFSNKNTLVTALCLLLLASVELLTGISANEGTLSMITIRNIEIPLTILLISFSLKQRRILTVPNILSVFLLAIIFVTDQLILFTSLAGIVFYYLFVLVRSARKKVKPQEDLVFYINFIAAAVLSRCIIFAFDKLGLASFYEMHNTNDNLSFVTSFSDMFNLSLKYIGKIFDVFGAGIFGQNISDGWLYVINIGVLGATLILSIRFFRSLPKKELNHDQKVLTALFLMYFFAVLIFTIIIPRELAGRYFAFLPPMGIMLIAYSSRSFKLKKPWTQYRYIIVAFFVILFLFACMAIRANDLYYREKYSLLSHRLGDTSRIVNILDQEKVSALIGMDVYEQTYWSNQIIKQQFDQKTGRKLAIVTVFCGTSIVDRQFTRTSWSKENGSRVAIRVKGCNLDDVKKVFGIPDSTYQLDKDDTLYIYSHDVRGKLDLRQYTENTFVKEAN